VLTDAFLYRTDRGLFAPCEARLIEWVGITADEHADFRRCVPFLSGGRGRVVCRPSDSIESKGIMNMKRLLNNRVSVKAPVAALQIVGKLTE
jgi:hypothetical protein